jgi:ATP-dependent Clp protease ATP-binding subunit ClpX
MRNIIATTFALFIALFFSANASGKENSAPDFAFPQQVSQQAEENLKQALKENDGNAVVRSLIDYSVAVDKINSDSIQSDSYVEDVQPQDLTKFGLIPEFVGRMPIVVGLHALDETALVKIMTEPKNAIVKQYKKLVGFDDVELVVTDDAVLEVAKKAISLKTGARGLRTIFENLMLDSMYYVPSESDIEKVIIDKDVVLGNKSPEIIRKNIA